MIQKWNQYIIRQNLLLFVYVIYSDNISRCVILFQKKLIVNCYLSIISICLRINIIFLLSSTIMQKVIKTIQQKTEDFFKTVEAGDISLFDIFEEAIAVFGFTKVGKTSSCHILANSPLKSQQSNGDFIYRPATQKYMTATVGTSPQSETEIPNIFETKMKDKNGFKSFFILDQPGYGDSYGFHRIFSNGYFHYRTFSKTPKLKFILAFKKVDLQGTGEKFKNTIEYFINTFASYDLIKNDILNATSFLITQADPKSKIDNLKKVIERLRDSSIESMASQEKDRFQEMINNMLKNNKVFVIQRPEQAGIITKQCDILKQIYDKTTFWVRDVRNNVVDMSPINFSVATEILTNLFSFKGKAVFKEQFDHFMNFMEIRVKEFLLSHKYSLKNIIAILQKDAVNGVEDHNFLQGMQNFVQTFYKFNDLYKDKREKREANLFNLSQLNDSSEMSKVGMINNEAAQMERQEKQKQMRQNYFIKKFKVLEFIKETIQSNIGQVNVQRSVAWLESISTFFVQMFKKFNLLRVQKTDSERIIYKYSYLIQRLIEESKILTLILFSNKEATVKFDSYRQNMVDIFRPLRDDLFIDFSQINITLLKQNFIKNINFQAFQVVNKEIIMFFESIPGLSEEMVFKIVRLISKYADIVIQRKRNSQDEEKRFVAFKLFQYRNKFYSFLKNIIKEGGNKKEKENCIQIIFTLSNALGYFLSGFQLYEQAREVFKSLNNSEFVFKNFDLELKSCQTDSAKTRSILMKYGQYAGQCHRRELAMKCFQEAYAKSKTYQQFKEVSTEIVNLKIEKSGEQDPYLTRFYNEEFCCQFSENLKIQIGMIYQEEKILAPY